MSQCLASRIVSGVSQQPILSRRFTTKGNKVSQKRLALLLGGTVALPISVVLQNGDYLRIFSPLSDWSVALQLPQNKLKKSGFTDRSSL
jgi:hypothetical protein